MSNFPLHDAILNHDVEKVMRMLKNPANLDVNAVSERQLTPLQVAAAEGLIPVALKLLLLGAEVDRVADVSAFSRQDDPLMSEAKKTALCLAVERGHKLLAEILVICRADFAKAVKMSRREELVESIWRSLNPQSNLIESVLSWLIINYQPGNSTTLFESLLNNKKPAQQDVLIEIVGEEKEEKKQEPEQAVIAVDKFVLTVSDEIKQGLLELASQLKKKEIISLLLQQNFLPRCEAAIPTAGYWAAVHDNDEAYALITSKSAAVSLLTLQQLQRYHEVAFNKVLARVNEAEQESLLASLDVEFPIPVIERLTAKQRHLLKLATYANEKLLSEKRNHENDLLVIFSHAVKTHNYVAANVVFKVVNQLSLLVVVLENYDAQGLLPYIFIHTKDCEQLISSLNLQQFNKLMTLSLTLRGLLQNLIIRSINNGEKSQLTDDEKKLIHDVYFSPSVKGAKILLAEIILRCLCDRYNEPRFFILLAHQGDMAARIKDSNAISQGCITFLGHIFQELGIDEIFNAPADDKLAKVSKDCYNVMLSFLDIEDLTNLSGASHYHRLAINRMALKPNIRLITERHFSLFDNVLQGCNSALNKINWFRFRFDSCAKVNAIFVLANIIFLALSIYYAFKYKDISDEKHALYYDTSVPTKYVNWACHLLYINDDGSSNGCSVLRCKADMDCNYAIQLCLPLCEDSKHYQKLATVWGYLWIPSTVILLLEFGAAMDYIRHAGFRVFSRGQARFNSVPLRELLPPELHARVLALHRELRLFDPHDQFQYIRELNADSTYRRFAVIRQIHAFYAEARSANTQVRVLEDVREEKREEEKVPEAKTSNAKGASVSSEAAAANPRNSRRNVGAGSSLMIPLLNRGTFSDGYRLLQTEEDSSGIEFSFTQQQQRPK